MSRAYAKTILFGEHAVVYGEPGIAIPIKSMHTDIELTDSKNIEYETNWELDSSSKKKLEELFSFLGINDKSIKIKSNIPISSGLGSSASLSVSLIRKVHPLWTKDRVNELAYKCEEIFHGTPSGIDNSVITYEKPVYYENGIIEIIQVKPFKILLIDSGVRSSTKDVVLQVRKSYESNVEKYQKILSQIGYISKKAREELSYGNIKMIGFLMIRNHELLRELGVSCDELDDIVKLSLEAGAYGAKMVGGGKGGYAIALVDETNHKKVEDKLRKFSDNIIGVDVN